MKNRVWLGVTAAAVLSFSLSAIASSGLTVINSDQMAYTLILEDAQEKSWEVQIGAGATLADICSDCYVAIKGQDEYEYAGSATVMHISDGKLVVESQE